MKVSQLIAQLQPFVEKGDPTIIWEPSEFALGLGDDLAYGDVEINQKDHFEGCQSDGYTLTIKLPEN